MSSCTFGPDIPDTCLQAPSWWTPLHIWSVGAAALLVLMILALIAAAVWDSLYPPRGQVTARQWFRLPKYERERRAAEFRAADEALQINGEAEELAGVQDETETFHLLNGRVNDLWPTVPWWCRR
jgi:hypothetical protein